MEPDVVIRTTVGALDVMCPETLFSVIQQFTHFVATPEQPNFSNKTDKIVAVEQDHALVIVSHADLAEATDPWTHVFKAILKGGVQAERRTRGAGDN